MEWGPLVDKLILEMLANRTPPTCIQSNILAVADTILPEKQVVEELPCVKHIRDMRVVLKTVSKLLAAKRFGDAKQIKQVHTDETSKRQTQVTNVVCQVVNDDDSTQAVCMTGDIIGADGTAEEQSRQIAQSFSELGDLLEKWREMTKAMYAEDPELAKLLELIPPKDALRLSRMLGVHISTDTCNTALLLQSNLGEILYCFQINVNC